MSDEFQVSVSMPLDDDGFLRRECPRCVQQFKWFHHDTATPDAELVHQYFCPLCGEPSGLDAWWTPEQLEYAQRSAAPDIDRLVQESIADAFKGVKGISFKPSYTFSLEIPTPDPLVEPNDMQIVEPPCHPHEPLKLPDAHLARAFCLVCGSPFSA